MNTMSNTTQNRNHTNLLASHEAESAPSFALGNIVATPGALALLENYPIHPVDLLERHARADWGDLCAEDCEANHLALEHGGRLLSAYGLSSAHPEIRLWIITEADRSVTTLLLPSEY